ncbi:MAG: DUF4139 domain-containing protein [candidate division Zixibacteria bacterium]|nr:DUF4139 domain-containing protein [candidate division Zixibacteria bacterium]
MRQMNKAFLAGLSVLLLIGSVSADEIAVTVYNSNLGVVSETRRLEFKEGTNRLAFRDVPQLIDAASVRFDVPERQVTILEQNYAFDLVSPAAMYAKYIDQEIELIDKDGRLYAGSLLAHSSREVTLRELGGRIKIVLLENIAEVSFPSLPEGLVTRPTLFWLYNSSTSGSLDCRVGYQTAGMDWQAEYVGLLSSDESELELSGWSSITNKSGKTYTDATLKLVAGDISRAAPPPQWGRMKALATADMEGAGGFEEKAFFEYHLYTLPRRATLADKEIKQISLFEPAGTAVEKIYTYRPQVHPTDVGVAVKFTNSASAGLGMPLPAGRMRMFKADEDGSMILIGEDYIKHTPRDEEIIVKVGNAFDIVAEERLMDQTRISQRVEDRKYEIEIRNRKAEEVTVRVEKRLYGFWEIRESSLPFIKKDATTVYFDVTVGSGQTQVLTMTVRFSNS